MRISHNLMAMNAQRNLNIVTTKKAKAAEKLSSGYKINRAADDAAGLAISEKMRRLIRGLDQGAENATDGISWSQSGDGALAEAHDILHRMTELTVKALNGTNTDSDRMALEMEFENLQSELDRISTNTTFNEINIFEQHQIPYYQCEGDVKWDPQQIHVVSAGMNDLTFIYRKNENDPLQTVTFHVPVGEYTTQELIDEIDNLTSEFNKTSDADIVLEFDQKGYCHANLEGGEMIDSVTGNMSYLLYQMFRGGGYGALIGTTSFPSEDAELEIVTGENDFLKFTIQNLDGVMEEREITIPAGWYTRQDLIDLFNRNLADTTVRANAYGDGIRLASEDAIVTGFKGNMFKIDGNGVVNHSVFYDNVKYGEVIQTGAVFTGGYVLPMDYRDTEHSYFVIDGSNNELTLQPSGFDAPVTLTIGNGTYTADRMVTKLNELFTDNNITTLTASVINDGSFKGLKITASDEGLDSKIRMDENSSAYDTLFRIKMYNAYEVTVNPTFDTKSNAIAYFKGSKNVAEKPLTIVAGQNDKFELSIDDGTAATYTITLNPGTYNSAEDIRAEIDRQLNGGNALAGYKGKIEVTLEDNKIKLTGTGIDGQGQTETLKAEEIPGNEGYKAIFQGYTTSNQDNTISGRGSITLNTPYDQNEGIDASKSQMEIEVDGKNYTINLPTGNPSTDQIKTAIENVISGDTTESLNTFTTVDGDGRTTDRNFNITATGTETVNAWSGSAQGTSDQQEGIVQSSQNTPAVLKVEVALNDRMVVDSTNNQITLTIKNKTEVITLDPDTYTKEELKDALQAKIDAVFGTARGSAEVSLDGNYLVLTSRLQSGENGKSNTISCSTDTSSFLKELKTTRTAATWISGNALNASMAITADNKEFTFQFTEGGRTKDVTISLTEGTTYTPESLKYAIQDQLDAQGIGVTASLNNGRLQLKSNHQGNDVAISYNTANGVQNAEVLFGPLVKEEPAKIITDCPIQNSITIDGARDNNNSFSITVNGNTRTITLDDGTYNPSSFLTMLNGKLSTIGVRASFDTNSQRLVYETIATGSGNSLSMSYQNGGTSMKSIYGATSKNIPPIKVSFNSEGKMTLTAENSPDTTIKVRSATGGPFQQAEKLPVTPTKGSGYHSQQHSIVDGVDLNGDIKIDQWNNTLGIGLYENGTYHSYYLDIPDATYTYSQLESTLRDLINDKAGTGKINVTVDADGVKLETVATGHENRMSLSGDFYYKVIGRAVERRDMVDVTAKEGTQVIDSAYTIGRKEIKGKTIRIQGGISDDLNIDLTYGQHTYTLSMKLDVGYYSSNQLKNHIQQKINEQLIANNLPAYLVEVGIGGYNTGVFGAHDDSALNFSLSKTIAAPESGQFLLDGVSGSAAFEIFYQTDGSLEQAYIIGTKDVSQGLEIKDGENVLSFEVDGVTYDITIPADQYTADEFEIALNQQLTAQNAPVKADIADGKVKLIHKKMGQHDIKDVTGSASNHVFFSENGRKEPKDARYVKLSSSTDASDRIFLDNPIFNTCIMNLNSACISKEKYARKALDRINEALEYVSNIRSNFGSTQNRLEHALRSNQNTAENLQAAESKIRDTDMAKEMVFFSNHNILQQVGQAMLAQANQTPQDVLALLR